MTTFKSLAELPTSRSNIVTSNSSSITRSNLKWETLSIEVRVTLPILAPISWHGLPSGLRTLDRHRMDVTGSSNVGDEYQVEVRVSIDCEPNSSFSYTRYPANSSNCIALWNSTNYITQQSTPHRYKSKIINYLI